MKIRGHIQIYPDGEQSVSATHEDGETPGAGAQTTHDESWLNIITDPHEGHVMLNIEALPALQRALRNIAKELKAKREKEKAAS